MLIAQVAIYYIWKGNNLWWMGLLLALALLAASPPTALAANRVLFDTHVSEEFSKEDNSP